MASHPWTHDTPEALGIASRDLLALLDHLGAQQINLHSLLIARRDRLALEACFHPYHADMAHDLRSAAKSITGLLAGMAIRDGVLPGADTPVLDFFPRRQIAHLDDRKRAITLRHLITMTSGLALTDPDTGTMLDSDDPVQFVLDAPMAAAPGAQFSYASANYFLASAIVQQAAGMTLAEYAQRALFDPLGIESPRWQASRQGITLGFGGLWLRPREMANLGLLVLNRGLWDGEPIVPPDWIAAATTGNRDHYGGGWWVDLGAGRCWASGYGGQAIMVLPDLELVITMTAGIDTQAARALALDWIVPAMRTEALRPDPAFARQLAARVSALAQPNPQPVPPLPPAAERVSGHRIALDSNGLGLTALDLDFGTASQITLFSGDDQVALPLRLDGVLRPVFVEHLGPLADHDHMAAAGRWDGETFALTLYSVNNPEYWRLDLRLSGGEAAITMTDGISNYSEQFAGRVV